MTISTKHIALTLLLLQPALAFAADNNDATFGNAVSASELDQDRGTGGTFLTTSVLNAELDGNTATGTVSGNNTMESGSMAFTGIGTVVQNSGNNVILQTATTVNVTVCQNAC